ncbi:hypothetical protein EYF80_004357 [Liparis tanakae]|uniref:Uncharacterized protein n=1 Tax=Liparis tanakae TaxID=230148 RepID=A0A4Z2J4Q3_9TELE|nr:hypothetical protein EYF80_004357 [Liparis tanakae]
MDNREVIQFRPEASGRRTGGFSSSKPTRSRSNPLNSRFTSVTKLIASRNPAARSRHAAAAAAATPDMTTPGATWRRELRNNGASERLAL